jgi:hypothetical protein
MCIALNLFHADRRFLQRAHENPDVPHEEDDPAPPNTDIFFSTFVLWQTGQGGCSFDPSGTNSSYSSPHFLQVYSYIGIKDPRVGYLNNTARIPRHLWRGSSIGSYDNFSFFTMILTIFFDFACGETKQGV